MNRVNFISACIIVGIFFYSRIMPFFGSFSHCEPIAFHVCRLILSTSCDFHPDLKYRLFGVVLMVLILCAGLVGGVTGILLPKICLGVSLGFSFALLLSTVRHRFLPLLMTFLL